MRQTRLFAIAIAALCMLLLLPMAGAMSIQLDPMIKSSSVSVLSANDNYPISIDQAKNSVRLFMNNLTLDPQLVGTGSLEIGNYYTLEAGLDTFKVNQNSGVVEFVNFGGNAPTSDKLTLTRDQAYAKATDYAAKKYDGYSGKTWKLIIDTVSDDGYWRYNETSKDYEYTSVKAYDFFLREEKEHVLLPNLIHLRINGVTGAVVDYWGVDRLVTAGLKNTVSLSEATETAESYLGHSDQFTLTGSEGYLAVVTRYQNVENLAWVIKLKGYYTWDKDEQVYPIIVDATDGSLLGTGWSSIWPESRLSNGYYNYY